MEAGHFWTQLSSRKKRLRSAVGSNSSRPRQRFQETQLLFIEPNIALRHCVGESDGSIVMRLAYESSPPWCENRDVRRTGIELAFPVASNDLRGCAEALRIQLASYPSGA